MKSYSFQGKLSDNKLAKFQLNQFRAADLELKTCILNFPKFWFQESKN